MTQFSPTIRVWDLPTRIFHWNEALFFMMATLVGIHLAGVVVESVLHRENLVAVMFHGRKRVENSKVVPDSVPARPPISP
ncbi:MAG: Ni hydr CYTB protein [Magnetococcales bacterium]|nr:Ni hydr CYTB protein [Magnetococcales bacterium]HIJ82709.1 hypothetical protein [Magnetococcales bacterium]